MSSVLDFLELHRGGMFVLFLCLTVLVFLVQWLAWIFSWGRFARPSGDSDGRGERFVTSNFFATIITIIDDFRSLLAIVIVLIFFLVMGYAVISAGGQVNEIANALQAVMATLGGLVGSIVGYYFGESAVKRASTSGETLLGDARQQVSPQDEEIVPVAAPKKVLGKGADDEDDQAAD